MIRRWLFSFTAAVSSLLCVGVISFWLRSHWRTDSFYCVLTVNPQRSIGGDVFALYSADGRMGLGRTHFSPQQQINFRLFWRVGPPLNVPLAPASVLHSLGFWHAELTGAIARTTFSATERHLPDWLLLIVFGLLPFRWVRRWYLQRPRKPGCLSCGYNLTGNTSGVCPECGGAITNKPEAVA